MTPQEAGEVKIAVRVAMVPGLFESGEGEPERGVDVFGLLKWRACRAGA
jgi:hypothetical protein